MYPVNEEEVSRKLACRRAGAQSLHKAQRNTLFLLAVLCVFA
jgi:hypothetical protein